jgi:hypothetical protein
MNEEIPPGNRGGKVAREAPATSRTAARGGSGADAEPAIEHGVLVMAYGTPRTREEVEGYYTDIRRGRAPTPELLAELVGRYDAIGGTSPLAERTEAQAAALQAALDGLAPNRYVVTLGLKHADPKIEAGIDELASRGVDRIVGLVLAPHYSAFSVGQYLDRARAAAARHDLHVLGIESWAVEPAFVDALATDVRRRLASMPANTKVLFTAHSLPQHPPGHRRPRRRRVSGRSARLRVRVRRRPPRGAVRPRHRGTPPGRGSRTRVRPMRVRQRRPRRHGRAGGASARAGRPLADR